MIRLIEKNEGGARIVLDGPCYMVAALIAMLGIVGEYAWAGGIATLCLALICWGMIGVWNTTMSCSHYHQPQPAPVVAKKTHRHNKISIRV